MTIARGEPMLASDILNLTFFPKGAILMFNSVDYVNQLDPSIWQLCDGQAGRPNLVNQFIRGGNSAGAGVGCADSQTITLSENNMPRHKHGVTVNLTDPGHYHTTPSYNESGTGGIATGVAFEEQNVGSTNRATTGITLSVSEAEKGGGGSFTVKTLPNYYAVIFIIKVV